MLPSHSGGKELHWTFSITSLGITFGFIVIVIVNGAPWQLPVIGVTWYTTLWGTVSLLFKVWEILGKGGDKLSEAPVTNGLDIGSTNQIYWVPGGAISGKTDPDGRILNVSPLQIRAVLLGINATESISTSEILDLKEPHPPFAYWISQ